MKSITLRELAEINKNNESKPKNELVKIFVELDDLAACVPSVNGEWVNAKEGSKIEKFNTITLMLPRYYEAKTDSEEPYIGRSIKKKIKLVLLNEIKYPNNDKCYKSATIKNIMNWINNELDDIYVEGYFTDDSKAELKVTKIISLQEQAL